MILGMAGETDAKKACRESASVGSRINRLLVDVHACLAGQYRQLNEAVGLDGPAHGCRVLVQMPGVVVRRRANVEVRKEQAARHQGGVQLSGGTTEIRYVDEAVDGGNDVVACRRQGLLEVVILSRHRTSLQSPPSKVEERCGDVAEGRLPPQRLEQLTGHADT